MNVVKVSAVGTNSLGKYTINIMSTLRHYPEAGVYYPDETIYTSSLDGKSQRNSAERIRFSDVKLNIPISPEQFTVKALGAPPHTGIARSYVKGIPSEEWDGEKVDFVRKPSSPRPRQPSTAPEPEQSPGAGRNSRFLWILAGGFLLGNALILWAVFYRQSPESKSAEQVAASPTPSAGDRA